MTAAKQRKMLRMVHLITGVALVAYVYLPAPADLRDAIRVFVLPVLVLTGVAMWQAPRLRRLGKPDRRRHLSHPIAASPPSADRRTVRST
jgi:hypothetical protein